MEIADFSNVILNLGTAGLATYTAKVLVGLRRDLAEAADQVRRDIEKTRALKREGR